MKARFSTLGAARTRGGAAWMRVRAQADAYVWAGYTHNGSRLNEAQLLGALRPEFRRAKPWPALYDWGGQLPSVAYLPHCRAVIQGLQDGAFMEFQVKRSSLECLSIRFPDRVVVERDVRVTVDPAKVTKGPLGRWLTPPGTEVLEATLHWDAVPARVWQDWLPHLARTVQGHYGNRPVHRALIGLTPQEVL